MRDAASLMTWAKEYTRELFITELGSLASTARTAFVRQSHRGDRRCVAGEQPRPRLLRRGRWFGNRPVGRSGAARHDNDLFNVTALDAMILKAKTCQSEDPPDPRREGRPALLCRARQSECVQEPSGFDRHRSSGDHQRPGTGGQAVRGWRHPLERRDRQGSGRPSDLCRTSGAAAPRK
jgi:hypothetical protein